jgi:hypothetical protein
LEGAGLEFDFGTQRRTRLDLAGVGILGLKTLGILLAPEARTSKFANEEKQGALALKRSEQHRQNSSLILNQQWSIQILVPNAKEQNLYTNWGHHPKDESMHQKIYNRNSSACRS